MRRGREWKERRRKAIGRKKKSEGGRKRGRKEERKEETEL